VNDIVVRDIDWANWEFQIPATLMFIVRDDEVLLIEKLTGIGEGKVNGPGGKIDLGETPHDAIIRECQEELHITPKNVEKMGELWFDMTHIPCIHCHVFVATEFDGEPTSTKEAIPRWTKISEIPFDRMWADDIYWLPKMLEGKKFNGRFIFEDETILWDEMTFGDESAQLWLGDQASATV